jgi:hypothetical protein
MSTQTNKPCVDPRNHSAISEVQLNQAYGVHGEGHVAIEAEDEYVIEKMYDAQGLEKPSEYVIELPAQQQDGVYTEEELYECI